MKLGIGITTFPWPAEQIGPVVSRIATAADEAGVDSLWVMDHLSYGNGRAAPWPAS
jgi:alkanesulfonate monooxygenase SsuD/methylene tetrahydromethanopterin reductase-like flavin-dependent oxidoreductase (luciferase family)